MERPITDEDIAKFIRLNKEKYSSQIALMQAAVQLLWPLGAPTAAGERVARAVLRQDHAQSVETNQVQAANRITRPLPPTEMPQTGPFAQTGPLAQTSPLG